MLSEQAGGEAWQETLHLPATADACAVCVRAWYVPLNRVCVGSGVVCLLPAAAPNLLDDLLLCQLWLQLVEGVPEGWQ